MDIVTDEFNVENPYFIDNRQYKDYRAKTMVLFLIDNSILFFYINFFAQFIYIYIYIFILT